QARGGVGRRPVGWKNPHEPICSPGRRERAGKLGGGGKPGRRITGGLDIRVEGIRMTAAGLLALALSASPVGADELRPGSGTSSPYHPVPKSVDVTGRATVEDVSGRVSLVDGAVVGQAARAVPSVGYVY